MPPDNSHFLIGLSEIQNEHRKLQRKLLGSGNIYIHWVKQEGGFGYIVILGLFKKSFRILMWESYTGY